MRFTRRSLILGLAAALGLDHLSLPRWLGGRARAAPAPDQVPPSPAPARLSPAELDDLLAFAELVVEGRPLSLDERGHLVEHVADRTRDPSGYYPELYRTTVSLLNRLAGARFSSLDAAQRLALLSRHRLTSADVRPGEALGPLPEDAREVRTRAIPDLIVGYYGSPAGWAMVGYGTFPGRCGDLARYTGPEP